MTRSPKSIAVQFCRMFKGIRPVFILPVFLLISALFSDVQGETYRNKESFFSISLPSGWTQIPRDSIKDINEVKKSQYEYFDYLYKIKESGSLFDYPYMLIQILRPEHSWNGAVADVVDRKLPAITGEILSGLDNKFYLDQSTGRVWQKSDYTTRDSTTLTRVSVFFVNGRYSYNVYFFVRKGEFTKYLPAFLSAAASLKPDPIKFLVFKFDYSKLLTSLITLVVVFVLYKTNQPLPEAGKNF